MSNDKKQKFDGYADKYDEFYERFCSFEDGNASKRIDDAIRK